MSTINNKDLVDKIIKADGYFGDDPRVAMIVEYTTKWNGAAWGITWTNEISERQVRYLIESEFIKNPKVIWKASIQ